MNRSVEFLSVGIDVGADFSLMAFALPSQELLGKPYKIIHSSQRSLNGAVEKIKTLSQKYQLPARVFMESTGIYHYPLYHKMKDAGFDVFVLNPLVTHAGRDLNVRNIHNDKYDSQKIALLGLRSGLKTSLIPSDQVISMKVILREYYAVKKEISMYICRLKNQLRQAFPQFLPLFSKVNGVTAMAILCEYPNPESLLNAGEHAVADFMKSVSHNGPLKVQKKAAALIQAAQDARSFGHWNHGISILIRHYIEMIRLLDVRAKTLLAQAKALLAEQDSKTLAHQTELLQTIPGIGFLSALTLICELGDFSAFKRPKQLFSYFGLDPIVRQSGNYNGTNLKLSKRGSPFARRCIFVIALQSISLNIHKEPKNPVLRTFYEEKCMCKAKTTAIGAVMHKICNLIFAVLRNDAPFVLQTPEQHNAAYLSKTHSVA